jgi:hypothetical protein
LTPVEGCAECQRISAAYEAATLEWFRLQGQLRIAEYSSAERESDSLVAELTAVAKRRQTLREEASTHTLDAHSRATGACS